MNARINAKIGSLKLIPVITLVAALLVSGCVSAYNGDDGKNDTTDKPAGPGDKLCAQVLTDACNPETWEIITHPNACIPDGWTTDLSQCGAGNSFEKSIEDAQSIDAISSDLDDVEIDSILEGL